MTRFEHLLGLGDAEGGGRLVEDDDARLLEHGAGDRDGLALAAGEGRDLLAHRLHGAHRERAQGVGGLPLHAALVEGAELRLLAAEEHVLHDVEVVAQREVLVHDLDAEARRIARGVQGDRLAVEADVALVVGLHAGETLDEGRLAGAVVADEGGDLAGVGLEVDALQDADRAEALDDPVQFDDRRVRAHIHARVHAASFRRRCLALSVALDAGRWEGTRPRVSAGRAAETRGPG